MRGSIIFVLVCRLSMTCFSQDSLLLKSVYFGGGSYYIDTYQSDELLNWINEVPSLHDYEIIIFSHTDNIGGVEYNKWLSQMRGEAVFQELIQRGIDKELIEIRDFGLKNPLYTNRSSAGRLMNRRVDVILWPVVF